MYNNDGKWSNKGEYKLAFYLFYTYGTDPVINKLCMRLLKNER